jgi:hypothetical protein
MLNTFQNSAQVLSIGVFFTTIALGLAATLPSAMFGGLTSQGVPAAQAHAVANLPPIGTLFAAFLGFNPIQQLLGSAAHAHISAAHFHFLTGRSFFPHLITAPFGHGLHLAFGIAAAMCFVGAMFSMLRGRQPLTAVGRSESDPIEVELAEIGG